MIKENIENQMMGENQEKKNFFSFLSSLTFRKNIFLGLIIFLSIFSLLGSPSKASAVAPTVILGSAPSIDNEASINFAVQESLRGNITSIGDSNVTARGFCVSTTDTTPTIAEGSTCWNDTLFTPPFAVGTWSHHGGAITASTAYYYSVYATNSTGTSYTSSGGVTFTSGSFPVITSTAVSNIADTTATIEGYYSVLGNPTHATYDYTGYTWGTSSGSSVYYAGSLAHVVSSTTVKNTTGAFTVDATGLPACTTIYYHAMINGLYGGRGLSPEASFTTTGCVAPTLTLPTHASVSTTTATLGATVTSAGTPATVTGRGVVFGTSSGSRTTQVSTTGTTGLFTKAVTGLLACTTYYYEGYADNSGGRGYSPESSFTTTGCAAPTIQATSTATSIGSSSFTINSNVLTLGAPNFTSKGVQIAVCVGCSFSTSYEVTGLTTGAFSKAVPSLSACQQYNTRAYVTSASGTVYSSELAVTTTGCVAPTLTATPTQSAITNTTATLGGNLVSGGVPVFGPVASDRGVQIGLTTSYTNSFSAGANTIAALGSATAPSIGTEQFGIRMNASGGTGAVSAPYATAGQYAYAANATTPSAVASATVPTATTTYSVRYMANISAITKAGSYTAAHTYIATGNF